MEYVKFNINAELRKFLKNKPTKVTPEILLCVAAWVILDEAKPVQQRKRPATRTELAA